MEVVTNIFDLRAIATKVFGEGGFMEILERRGMYRSRIASVVDTEWQASDSELIAYHQTVDPEPIVEKFNFPPTWSNRESWANTFGTDYPDCAADALDVALWSPRTPSKIVIEDDNGVRVLKSIDTDPVTKVEFRKQKPVKNKAKQNSQTKNLFGE